MDWIKSLCVLDLKLCKTCHESFVAKCPQRKVCTLQKFIFHKNASLTSYNRKTIPYTVVHADKQNSSDMTTLTICLENRADSVSIQRMGNI